MYVRNYSVLRYFCGRSPRQDQYLGSGQLPSVLVDDRLKIVYGSFQSKVIWNENFDTTIAQSYDAIMIGQRNKLGDIQNIDYVLASRILSITEPSKGVVTIIDHRPFLLDFLYDHRLLCYAR
jgi:hypothetical protein